MVRKISKSAGFPDLRVVEYPAPIALDDKEAMEQRIAEAVTPKIIQALTEPVRSTAKKKAAGAWRPGYCF